MNNTTKILLTIELEGGTLVKGEPQVKEYVLTKNDFMFKKKLKGKEGNKIVKKGKYIHYDYTTKPAFQHINMSRDAYLYFISNECPEWSIPKIWSKLTPKERLEIHLLRTCQHFRGKSFSYEILDD